VPQNMTVTTTATSGSQLAVGLVNSSVRGTGSIAATTGATLPVLASTDFSASLWLIPDTDALYETGAETGNCQWFIGYESSSSKYFVRIFDAGSGLERIFRTDTTYDGGASRMVSFSFNVTTKALLMYLDGVAVATTQSTAGAIIIIGGESAVIGSCEAQQFIIWTSIVSQATFQEIWKYSTVSLPETTTARAQRIIAQTPFNASLCSFPASPAGSVLDITDDAPFAAPELRLVAASEGGPLFVSKNGTVTMYQQNQQYTQTRSIVSQVTYGTGGTDMGQLFELMPDGDSVRNVANVSMSQGGVYTLENSTSVTAYGTASESVDTQVQTYANAQVLGQMVTGFGGNIYPRLAPVDVVLDSANNWSPTMALELMDRITINAQPPSGGNAITVPMLVQNIKHSATPGFWQTTLEGSARWAAVFILDQSLLDGTDLII
jgi:hypothetical protein